MPPSPRPPRTACGQYLGCTSLFHCLTATASLKDTPYSVVSQIVAALQVNPVRYGASTAVCCVQSKPLQNAIAARVRMPMQQASIAFKRISHRQFSPQPIPIASLYPKLAPDAAAKVTDGCNAPSPSRKLLLACTRFLHRREQACVAALWRWASSASRLRSTAEYSSIRKGKCPMQTFCPM